MASVVANKATRLLIFISIIQGIQSLLLEHKKEVNATVGQNISLPCIIPEKDQFIIQLQWHKNGEQKEQTLVVFNPVFPVYYHAAVKLEPVNQINTTILQGSILHLDRVTEEDSGNYVCDITLFPYGSFKISTKVQVTEPQVSMKVMSPNRTVIEEDNVSITCVSDPPADNYRLLSSQSHFILESQAGKFTIQNISRHISYLICQPFWNSLAHLQSLQATVQLTVDFLDTIECNSGSQIQVETGGNLAITCKAKSSKPLSFVWMKGNVTVSSSATINLWSVNLEHSGIYILTVHSGNHSRLHRQKEFTVTVFNRTHTEPLSSTMTMETTSQISSTTMTTAEPSTMMLTSQSHSINRTTSTEKGLYISTTAPSTGNATTLPANTTTPRMGVKSSATTLAHTSSEGITLSEICCRWQNATASPGSNSRDFTHVHPNASMINSTVTTGNVLMTQVTVKESSNSKTHVVCIIIPVLLLLVLSGFLYRRYLIQKRLDMPPPFKPPPPPVKYTAAKNQDSPMTDIFV